MMQVWNNKNIFRLLMTAFRDIAESTVECGARQAASLNDASAEWHDIKITPITNFHSAAFIVKHEFFLLIYFYFAWWLISFYVFIALASRHLAASCEIYELALNCPRRFDSHDVAESSDLTPSGFPIRWRAKRLKQASICRYITQQTRHRGNEQEPGDTTIDGFSLPNWA